MPDDPNTIPPQALNLHQRINKVMQEVTYVQKEKKQGMKYSVVSHDVVTAKLRPSLVNYGIAYYPACWHIEQQGNRTQASGTVRFVNIDAPLDFIDVATIGYGIDDQDKGPGKAISYAVKYALLKAFGLETGDDPDEDQEVVLKADPQDPDRTKIDAFENEIARAKTMDQLRDIATHYADDMKAMKAKPSMSAFAQAAEVKWRQKAALLKKTDDRKAPPPGDEGDKASLDPRIFEQAAEEP